jgi:hypothetical protein
MIINLYQIDGYNSDYPRLEIHESFSNKTNYYRCKNLYEGRVVGRKLCLEANFIVDLRYLDLAFVYMFEEMILYRDYYREKVIFEKQWFWNYPSVQIIFHDY